MSSYLQLCAVALTTVPNTDDDAGGWRACRWCLTAN